MIISHCEGMLGILPFGRTIDETWIDMRFKC